MTCHHPLNKLFHVNISLLLFTLLDTKHGSVCCCHSGNRLPLLHIIGSSLHDVIKVINRYYLLQVISNEVENIFIILY